MPVRSRYSLVQCVPNELNDERINVAVVATDGTETVVETLHNWSRFRAFWPGADVEYVKRWSMGLANATQAELESLVKHGAGSVRLTGFCPSTLGVRSLLARMASLLLVG